MSRLASTAGTRAGHSWQITLPSWLVSLLLHGALLMIVASTLKSCGGSGLPTTGTDEYQEVGIFLRRQTEETTEVVDTEVSETATPSRDKAREADSLDSAMAELLDAPETEATRPVIGPGLPNDGARQGPTELVASSGAAGSAPAAGAGRRAIPFFGSSDTGKSVVYVVDRSSSMYDSNALGAAKSELIASLQSLDSTQTFQVILYNKHPDFIPSVGRSAPQMLKGTDLNRTVAGRFIAEKSADGATDHLPALEMALKLQPEVIFFLSDADEPTLKRPDFERVRQWNDAGTRIHCIEFGRGESLGIPNFLQQLARENDGTYRYRNVRQFENRPEPFGR